MRNSIWCDMLWFVNRLSKRLVSYIYVRFHTRCNLRFHTRLTAYLLQKLQNNHLYNKMSDWFNATFLCFLIIMLSNMEAKMTLTFEIAQEGIRNQNSPSSLTVWHEALTSVSVLEVQIKKHNGSTCIRIARNSF